MLVESAQSAATSDGFPHESPQNGSPIKTKVVHNPQTGNEESAVSSLLHVVRVVVCMGMSSASTASFASSDWISGFVLHSPVMPKAIKNIKKYLNVSAGNLL